MAVAGRGGPDSGDRDLFPDEMEPVEWDDQFVTFQEAFLQEARPRPDEAPDSSDSSSKIVRFRRD